MHSNSKFYMQRVDIARQQPQPQPPLQHQIGNGSKEKKNETTIINDDDNDDDEKKKKKKMKKNEKHANRKESHHSEMDEKSKSQSMIFNAENRNQIIAKRKEMLSLLDQAENMYNIGRFQLSLGLFAGVEHLVHQVYDPHLDSHPYYTYLARAILGEAKAKFKMGDIKSAHELVGQAMQFSPSTDAEHVLREVEKMSYFENLLNFSLTNPLHAYATTTDQSQLLQQQQKWAVGLDLPQTVGLYTRNSSLYSSLMNVSGSPPCSSLMAGAQSQQPNNGGSSPGKLALLESPRNLTTLDYFSPSSVVVSTVPRAVTHQTHKPDLLERKVAPLDSDSDSNNSSHNGGCWQKTFLQFVKQHRID